MNLDEPQYLQLADRTFRRVCDLFDRLDPDDAEATLAGDVLTMTFKNGVKAVLNTQRPTRQLWLAARANAWHFDYDAAGARWVDDKRRGDELFSTLRAIVRENAGVELEGAP